MTIKVPRRTALAFALTGGAASAANRSNGAPSVEGAVRTLLDSYARQDLEAVINQLDPSGCVVVGTDIREHATTPAAIRALLTADFGMWESSQFGPMNWFHATGDDHFATALFEAPWTSYSGADRAEFVIRFATAWRRRSGGWKLCQALNQVATVDRGVERTLSMS